MRNTSKRTSIPKKVANLKEVYCFNESTGYLEDLSNQNILINENKKYYRDLTTII
jgi:hypothetical protein